jgi:Flp pilus assembly protein TadB
VSYPAPEPSVTDTGEAPSRSVGEIVGDIASDLSKLMRQEIALAKTELKEEANKAKTELKQEATKAGKGAGMLGGAALAGYFATFFVSLALMFALAYVIGLAWSSLVVAVLWAIGAAVLAAVGRKKLKQVDAQRVKQAATPELDLTTQTLKEDAQWVKTRNG